MKKYRLIVLIGFVLSSHLLKSQSIDTIVSEVLPKYHYAKALSILKDSVWIGKAAWKDMTTSSKNFKQVQYFKDINEAKAVKVEVIPVLKVRDPFSIHPLITIDTSMYYGLLYNAEKLIGEIMVYAGKEYTISQLYYGGDYIDSVSLENELLDGFYNENKGRIFYERSVCCLLFPKKNRLLMYATPDSDHKIYPDYLDFLSNNPNLINLDVKNNQRHINYETLIPKTYKEVHTRIKQLIESFDYNEAEKKLKQVWSEKEVKEDFPKKFKKIKDTSLIDIKPIPVICADWENNKIKDLVLDKERLMGLCYKQGELFSILECYVNWQDGIVSNCHYTPNTKENRAYLNKINQLYQKAGKKLYYDGLLGYYSYFESDKIMVNDTQDDTQKPYPKFLKERGFKLKK